MNVSIRKMAILNDQDKLKQVNQLRLWQRVYRIILTIPLTVAGFYL